MTRVLLTYREYAALPDDGRRYEIHDGDLSVTPAPGLAHQKISQRLFDVLFHHVQARGLGEIYYAPVDVILSDRSVVQPDIVFVENSRRGVLGPRGIEGAPTLAVEIMSPSSTLTDRATKHQLYARHGVPYYWIVDPEARAVEAYGLGPGGYTLALRATGPEPVSPPPFEGLA
ncbi:MAG: Uma2 family endonuclease, partial [Candidatus Rokubacteria bacterium]|nr:Uma2 family endonuclease [Candidatus Rokubacteria bacterium]